MNHAPAILAVPAVVYSMQRVLVAWIIVAHFHLCSSLGTLSRYTVLEVRTVRWRVCCGSWWGWCVLFINIFDSLTAPCLVHSSVVTVSKCWLSVGFGRFYRKNLGFRFGLGFHDKHVVNFFITRMIWHDFHHQFITSSNDKQPHTLSIMHSKKQKSYELTSSISLRML